MLESIFQLLGVLVLMVVLLLGFFLIIEILEFLVGD